MGLIASIKKDIEATRRINFDDQIASKATMRKEALKLMQRYMTDIYSMTTVNLDHLFASLLRFLRHKTFDKLDLCRRVFLASFTSSGWITRTSQISLFSGKAFTLHSHPIEYI